MALIFKDFDKNNTVLVIFFYNFITLIISQNLMYTDDFPLCTRFLTC